MIADERGDTAVKVRGRGRRAAPGERRDRSARAAASAESRREAPAGRRDRERWEWGRPRTRAGRRRAGSEAGVRGVRRRGRIRRVSRTSRSDLTRVSGPADGSPTWRSAAARAAPRPRAGTDRCPRVKRRRLGVIADAHVRRRAAFRVAVGRRTRRRRRSRGAVRRRETTRRAHRATARERRRRAGRARATGSAVPPPSPQCRGSRGGRNGRPVCVSLSSSAREYITSYGMMQSWSGGSSVYVDGGWPLKVEKEL